MAPRATQAGRAATAGRAAAGGTAAGTAKPAWTKWFNPATAPFIPVPEIAVDPDSGTTIGVIPTWVTTDENHNVRRIIAPDIIYNQNFGVGTHMRVYSYSSADEQWSLVAGIKQRVEREFDAEYKSDDRGKIAGRSTTA